MRKNLLKMSAAMSLVIASVTACGGGSDTFVDTRTTFTSAFTSSIAALTTAAGLQGNTFLDLVDSSFLDGGYTKAQMADNISKDAASLTGATAVSLFPGVNITNPQITCGASTTICTFSGTIVNSDADTTETTFSTPVIFNNGAFRLSGDQASS
jgi:hypothetical protein